MQVDFYHLGRDPLHRVLASVAGRVVSGGGRMLVVTADETQAAAIDAGLWEGPPDSFLAHGREGADQPVLIASTCEAANGARFVALIDGTWRDEATGFERAFHFFDESSIEAARAAWRDLKNREGVEPRYWKQEEGGWRQVA